MGCVVFVGGVNVFVVCVFVLLWFCLLSCVCLCCLLDGDMLFACVCYVFVFVVCAVCALFCVASSLFVLCGGGVFVSYVSCYCGVC